MFNILIAEGEGDKDHIWERKMTFVKVSSVGETIGHVPLPSEGTFDNQVILSVSGRLIDHLKDFGNSNTFCLKYVFLFYVICISICLLIYLIYRNICKKAFSVINT